MPFKPHNNANPKGRPRQPEVEQLRNAIEETQIEKKKTLWKHLVEQCYVDNNVLKAVANKFVPDMTMLSIDPENNKIIVEFKK